MKDLFERDIAIFLRFLEANVTAVQLAKDFKLSQSRILQVIQNKVYEILWTVQKNQEEHPYTIERYPHAYQNQRRVLYSHTLLNVDLWNEKSFWIQQLEKLRSEHQPIENVTLNDPVQGLNLIPRIKRLLITNDIKTVEALICFMRSPTRWKDCIGFGQGTFKAIEAELGRHGFTFQTETTIKSREALESALAFISQATTPTEEERAVIINKIKQAIN